MSHACGAVPEYCFDAALAFEHRWKLHAAIGYLIERMRNESRPTFQPLANQPVQRHGKPGGKICSRTGWVNSQMSPL